MLKILKSMIQDKLKKLTEKISSVRIKKGYTLDNMAHELDLTQASYRKIEIGETNLSVERLFQISEILDTPLNELLEIGNDVFQQTNNENTSVYQQKVENFYQENKEVYEKLLQSKDEQIALLKSMLKM